MRKSITIYVFYANFYKRFFRIMEVIKTKSLRCSACNAPLKHVHGNLYICEYCDTEQYLTECDNVINIVSLSDKYDDALSLYYSSETSEEYLRAADMFDELESYGDAKTMATECRNNAETSYKNELYNSAVGMMNEDNIHFLEQAKEIFNSLSGWKDADDLKLKCSQKISAKTAILTIKNVETKARHKVYRIMEYIVWSAVIALAIWLLCKYVYF